MKNMKVGMERRSEIEAFLESHLRPVDPRPEFVSQLKQRLLDSARPIVKIPSKKYLDYGLIATASLIGSALVLITGVRAVLTFMSALGVIHLVKRQTEDKNFSPPEAAI